VPTEPRRIARAVPQVCDHRGVSIQPLRRAADDDGPFAVIDIGSNSGRMIVFRLQEGGHLDVLEDARAPLRLARALRETDELGENAIERTLEALRDFRAVAEGAGAVSVTAVATSAVRDAADGKELLARAAGIGIPLQVIDGEAEARLGFLGAVHDLPVASGLTMDVGGGSTELSLFRDRQFVGSWTVRLGSLRISDLHLASDPPTDKELKRARNEIAAVLRAAEIPLLANDEALVGIGGTIRNLAKMDLRRSEYPLPLLHGYVLESGRIGELTADLAARKMARRTRISGLNPDRVDTIVGGALIVQGIVDHVGAAEVVVSSRGLREGLALDRFGGEVPPAWWVRTISVATLASRFTTWSAAAGSRRAQLAATLHEATDPDAPDDVREMLGHAATVLDVGRAIDYYNRFEHAAMIVTSADLAGFFHADLGLLTAILRQADDDVRLGPYGRLVDAGRRTAVLRAATALALADELNRRIQPGVPATLSCTFRPKGFELVAPVPAGWRPRGVATRFRQVFGRPLIVVPAESASGPVPPA
jgi:exopolyphosphatase / guanosine-5'-triphosphate,3'-diphosphate pyrophosphatase